MSDRNQTVYLLAPHDKHGGILHWPVWAVEKHVERFIRATYSWTEEHGEAPRIAILSWLDYLWLRAGVLRIWEGHNTMRDAVQLPELNDWRRYPDHFQFRGVTIFEGKHEKGDFVFA